MELGLIQKQTTNLIMTQELRQAIHILQLSAPDLSAYIYEQSMENPLMDVKERQVASEQLDLYTYSPIKNRSQSDEDYVSPIDYARIEDQSLRSHLLEQLYGMPLTRKQQGILSYYIDSLREDGYLSRPLEQICEDLMISIEEGEQCLTILQGLEPAGIAARHVQECLLLQLQRLPKRSYLAEQIITSHLELFAQRKWRELASQLQLKMGEIQEVSDLLKTLNPRPGSQFTNEPIAFIAPELEITIEDEQLVVKLIDHLIPAVQMNERYDQLIKHHKEMSEYGKQMKQQVHWLQRSIAQRKSTIVKVGEVIARHQADYFLKKDGLLKPLTLRDVAEEIGVHESTVSRATMNKYARTPRGLLELKTLFSTAVQSNIGEKTSNQSVKQLMQTMIAEENKQKPISDAKIVERLKTEHKITISRRAIAKYREELGIPSSTNRKRFD